MNKYVSVGKILNFHGIKGEVKVGFSKNQQDFFLKLQKIYLGNEYKELDIEYSKLNKNFAIVKFSNINSINEVLDFKGKLLFVKEETIREQLDEDEFLIDELVGLRVVDNQNKNLGIIIGVSNNGATDLLSVKTNSGKNCFVPFVKALVTDVNLSKKIVVLNNIEGLLE